MTIPLVTLARARKHLRDPPEAANADIQFKVEQASGIIVEYLKSRAHVNPVTIAASSVASPTVITVPATHPFTNGQTVVITGHMTSVPDLNGSWVISNVAANSFTIPIAVTTAGTGGVAATPWTDATVPFQVQSAILLVLTHLYERRGDDMAPDSALWEAVGRLLVRSRDPAVA